MTRNMAPANSPRPGEKQKPWSQGSHLQTPGNYFFFCAALILAHRTLAARLIAALAAALMVNFFLGATAGAALAAFILAHRAFWAALIRAMPAALIFFRASLAGAGLAAGVPRMEASSFPKVSIFSLMATAFFSWARVSADNGLLIGWWSMGRCGGNCNGGCKGWRRSFTATACR